LEDQLNLLSSQLPSSSLSLPIATSRHIWQNISQNQSTKNNNHPSNYTPIDRDIIKQLLSSFGLRITGYYSSPPNETADDDNGGTLSYLVTSKDPWGVKMVVTSLQNPLPDEEHSPKKDTNGDDYAHFDKRNLTQFFASHHDREGIAVLAFEVATHEFGGPGINNILERYRLRHPSLIKGRWEYDDAIVLEVYAYHRKPPNDEYPADDDRRRRPGDGTVLRFVQFTTLKKIPISGYRGYHPSMPRSMPLVKLPIAIIG